MRNIEQAAFVITNLVVDMFSHAGSSIVQLSRWLMVTKLLQVMGLEP